MVSLARKNRPAASTSPMPPGKSREMIVCFSRRWGILSLPGTRFSLLSPVTGLSAGNQPSGDRHTVPSPPSIDHDNDMLSETEKTLLQELLALAPVPEQTLGFNELMGYMFGLAITPVPIPDDEWMTAIFTDAPSGISAEDQARSMATVLQQVHTIFTAREARGELEFPYELETLEYSDLEEVLEWVSGFEEALNLRSEIWAPEDDTALETRLVEELYFSLMVIQGLAEPEELTEFFDKLPDEVIAEAFVTFEPGRQDRSQQIQAFLLATLPLAIRTLRQYAKTVATTRLRPVRSTGKKTPRKSQAGDPVSPLRRDNVIEVDFATRTKKKKQEAEHRIYQLKIGLHGARPPIWRRITVPDHLTLADLHEIIQVAMGWSDSHLHQFQIGGQLFGTKSDDWDTFAVHDEEKYTLHDLAHLIEPYFSYTYDFGDDWHHRITVEKSIPAHEGSNHPVLLKGKRACPPENCGGVWGYGQFLEAYLDPDHPEYEAMRDWAGEDFDPEEFSKEELDEINEYLRDQLQ